MLLKVSSQGGGIITNVAKVNSPATFCQKQESVKLLKDDAGWLVDGTQDS